jgi:hypothetical protein
MIVLYNNPLAGVWETLEARLLATFAQPWFGQL